MNFGILIFPNVEELDFVGPWGMLTLWQKYAAGPENCLVIAQSENPLVCAKGLSVNPHKSFGNCPPLDYLLVPGGQGTRDEVNNPALIHFIEEQAKHCKSMLSVCTGSFLLHKAGLLSGKKATTHWGSLDRMRELGDVEVMEKRFVQDGTVWTSAGVSAGTDMMLAFISAVAGEETAGTVQCAAEYYPDAKHYSDFAKHPKAPAYLRNDI
jgi:transcriptional regulator GlxA family with amidase domain